MSPDRNLLFGILAVQMNFVSRDALIAAMNAWVLDKHRPLADILQEQGQLSADRAGLLNALVAEHLKTHDNDPHKSLAALSSVQSVKAALQQVADPDVQQSIGRLAPRERPDPFPTGSFVSREAGSRFLILRPHARGGLGEVFVAEDTELHREVALKEIQHDHADNPDSRGRFLLEAEVTGGLEHPNIVPVYGLGTYTDGRPFYAMRFIRGDSLKDAIKRYHGKPFASESAKNLAFRDLLKRFVDVCNAIAYAHSRGILHRDLKPGNIMLGKYGETLVVDWGLAKPLGRAESRQRPDDANEERPLQPTSGSSYQETLAGMVIGTPAFMSPEQAAGRLDDLGPTTDVYSLGATLYMVLTGQVAFDGQMGDMLRQIQAGEFRAPKQVRGDVPAALNAVVLKAMARRPADRYPTATALAEDVEHFLADEPLNAYREPVTVRTKRWMRKHPGIVSGIAATVLVGVVGLSAGLYFVNAEKNRTELARQDEERQKLKAEESERQATAAKEQARKSFAMASNAYSDMVFNVNQRLADTQGSEELRIEIIEKAREGLTKLIVQSENSLQAEHALVWGQFYKGDILRLRGNIPGARTEYREGHRLAIDLASRFPDDVEIQRLPMVSLAHLGQVAERAQEAFDHFRKAKELTASLVARYPANARLKRDLSLDCTRVGETWIKMNRLDRARQEFLEGLAIDLQMVQDAPKNGTFARTLAIRYNGLGHLSLNSERPDEADGYFRKSLDISTSLAANPRDLNAQFDLAASYQGLGDVCEKMNQHDLAIGFFERNAEIVEKLVESSKSIPYRRSLVLSYHRSGDVEFARPSLDRALVHYEKALKECLALALPKPLHSSASRDLSLSYQKLGRTRQKLGRIGEALADFQSALAISKELANDPKDATAQRDYSIDLSNVGDILLERGQITATIDHFHQTLQIRKKIAAESEASNPEPQYDLMAIYHRLGQAEQTRFKYADAEQWYVNALAVADSFRPPARFARERAKLSVLVAVSRKADRAVADVNFVLQQPSSEVPALLDLRLRHFRKDNDLGNLASTAAAFSEFVEKEPSEAYNAACGWSLASGLIKGDTKLKDEYASKAIALLRKSLTSKGPFVDSPANLAAHMKQDKDLDPLRDREDFKKLLAELEAKGPAKKP